MASADQPGPAEEGRAAWQAFARRHAGNPLLEQEALYALSLPLLDAIAERVPGFLAPEQELFERDLAATASFGFFHGRALGASRQPRGRGGAAPPPDERQGQSAHAIRAMWEEELRGRGLPDSAIHWGFRHREQRRGRIDACQEAYGGWLVLNPQYRAELDALRAAWGPVVRSLGRFPELPRWPLLPRESFGAAAPAAFVEACSAFYTRWGLERLLTWDWPVPMEPELADGPAGDRERLDAGLVLVVPWYLLRGERVSLQEAAQQGRWSGPEHLHAWLFRERSGGRAGGLDAIRYARLRRLYRYHELVLVRRYGGAVAGNVQRLDVALARALPGRWGEDTVKKLRLLLQRRLHGG
jgi:hypothetical protein